MLTFALDDLIACDADMGGYCIECGCRAFNVEPDARMYKCEECGRFEVYGAEELIVMGMVSDA